MRYAILSDVHGRRHKLEAVLADARARNAEQILSLGDVGGEECLTLLREACAEVVTPGCRVVLETPGGRTVYRADAAGDELRLAEAPPVEVPGESSSAGS